jgi:transposase
MPGSRRSRNKGHQNSKTLRRRLKRDYDAVKAGLTLEWSNGQTEGQVHRLKLLKRQMYGRGRFDLLRKRVLKRA